MNEKFEILDNIKKHNKNATGFSVPDNYFESFDDKMIDIISVEEQPLAKKIVLVLKPWLSLAAIFTIIALIYYNTPHFRSANTIADVSFSNEITIDLISSDFDEFELIDIISDDNNNAVFENIHTDPNLLEGLTYEDVEDLVIF